jgi:predicted nucleic acid-binding protein
MSLVLDASAALALALPDEEAPGALKDRLMAGDEVVVPSIFATEVANACVVAVLRKRMSPAQAHAALAMIEQLEPSVSAPRSLSALVDVALRFDVSAYDATYLATAMTRGADLATNDARLRLAAARAGVELV